MRRFSFDGNANPVQSATLMIRINRGSFPIQKRAHAMSDLTIGNTSIRQLDGLYNLNDLHKVAGSEKKHQPNRFIRLEQTRELIKAIKCPDLGISDNSNFNTNPDQELISSEHVLVGRVS